MKQKAKLYKEYTNRKVFKLNKKLGSSNNGPEDAKMNDEHVNKRKKVADGKVIEVQKKDITPLKAK